ncbi:MAG: tyrosine-type recombinase/integrase [Opitutaceae bacterium]|nr:tyrosine-type recombinase/integrase [Opitutaceae bacterium]
MPTQRIADEYPPKSGILIAHKTNPTGSRAYRVDIASSLTGAQREQRQFPTKEQACRYAKQRHEEIVRHGHAAFALTTHQRSDALKALALLSSCNVTLCEAARIVVKQHAVTRERLTVSQLYARFMAAPGRRKSQAIPRRPLTVINLTWRLNRFERDFGSRMASEVTTSEVQAWLASLGPLSAISFNNHRRVLHAMFAYGLSEGYLASNPIAKIPLYVVTHKAPPILTVEDAERLLNAAWASETRLGLLGFVVLGLFAGIRRAELERLDWSAVKWERKMVTVDGTIAKSGSIRNVTLSENALAWLASQTAKTGPVCPRNIKIRLRELWKLAGFKKEGRNELRHSFASYHYDLHQNGPLTAAQLGHSTGTHLLFTHYRSLVQLGEGKRYFSLLPPTPARDGGTCQQTTEAFAVA